MSNTAVTAAACNSKDLSKAIDRIVDAYVGMSWIVVERDTKRIVTAAYSLQEARKLAAGRNCYVKNVNTGRIAAIAA